MERNNIVKVAATQIRCCDNFEDNITKGQCLVREAAQQGAHIILLQELFQGLYFCQEQNPKHFDKADEYGPDNNVLRHFIPLAKELGVVLPISYYERASNAYYNSLAVIDSDGSLLGNYRKSHIPDGNGYQEKFYFSPGDTGFKVFKTRFAAIGVAICWDQWFPEAARAMVLQGAEILFYPTAIGSEPQDPSYDSQGHWERTMCGHSAANLVPLVASNRVGTETFGSSSISFYGSSFLTDCTGAVLHRADRISETVLVTDVDLAQGRRLRHSWGVFRDRRPELYGPLLTKDGHTSMPGVSGVALR